MEKPVPVPAKKDSDLNQWQRSFDKAYTTFQTQAASLVGLTRQFKELQARWGSTEDELRTRFREVRDREREVGAREKKLEERKAEMEALEKQVESSKYHLSFVKPLITKHVEELDALKVMVSEKKEEFDLVEKRGLKSAKRLGVLEKCVVEKAKEVELREVEGKIEDRKRECGLKVEEIEAKRRCMDEWEKEMEVKRGELVDQVDAMKILVREKGKECELIENRVLESEKREYYFGRCVEERRKEFENKEKVLKEIEGRIRLKEMELDGVLKSIQEQTKECDLKGKQVKALQMSIEKCEEMELKREEWSCKLELKERELERLFEKFELRGKQFEPIIEELRVIVKRVDECSNEVLCKERYLQSSEKSIQERERALDSVSHELKLKERHIEEEAKQLELKQTQFSCQVKTQELEREKYLDALQMQIEAVKKGFRQSVQDQIKHLDSLSQALHTSERQVEGKELELKFKLSDSEVNTERLDLTPASGDLINTDGRSFEVIPGIIRNRIERKQLIEAVTYICNFKQIDKFPLVPLLKEYVEYAKKSCTEIFSKEISHDEKEYRPIALSNFVFKIIPKILSLRLASIASRIISPQQHAFVPGRHIADYIIIISECINLLDSKCHGGNVVIKMDITKAFDTLLWDFILHVLEAFGFHPTFVSWVRAILHSTKLCLLVNKRAVRYISCGRGVHQGELLSPLLFCLAEEVLNRGISELLNMV
ncbi:hypothetical protein ACLB2K_064883 [Fragaria x ananassa]